MSIEIHGHSSDRWQPLAAAFAQNFEDGLELGASISICAEGDAELDLWAGHADRKRTRPWERDTITALFSTIKVMLHACVLKLVADGKLDLDQRIAHYWPAYGAAGKADTTLRHVITFRAGVPGFDPPQRFEALHDWDHITAVIAASTPRFEPGTTLCYHPTTHGFILGEVIRRTAGRMVDDYFLEAFARPLDIALRVRLDAELAPHRAQQLWSWNPPAGDDPRMQILTSAGQGNPEDPDRLHALIPASSGHGNARGVARFGAMLAQDGELDGRRYISAELMREARSLQVEGDDVLMGPMRLGLGFGLHSRNFPAPTPGAFHWGGMGGSFVVMVPEHRLAFAYAMNHYVQGPDMDMDARQARLWQALCACLAKA